MRVATQDLPRSAAHPFYARLNQILDARVRRLRRGAGATAPTLTAAETAPTIFSALQERLGLRLRSERGNVDIVVIDQIEPPTPD